MIPQIDQKWFLSQLVWSILFFAANYYINFFSYKKLKSKQKEYRYFVSLRNEQIDYLKEEIVDIENELSYLKEIEIGEKDLIKTTLQMEAKALLAKRIEDHILMQNTKLKEVKESMELWLKSFDNTQIKEIAEKMVTKIEAQDEHY